MVWLLGVWFFVGFCDWFGFCVERFLLWLRFCLTLFGCSEHCFAFALFWVLYCGWGFGALFCWICYFILVFCVTCLLGCLF